MPTSIPELIAEELITRLQSINAINGYTPAVATVTRVDREARGWSPTNLAVAVTQPIDSRNPALDHEGNPPAEAHDLAFNIHVFVRQPKDATDPDQKTENALVANIIKAVTAPSDWHTFGGNAFNADWGSRQNFVPNEGENAGATLPLIVQYRVSETDPFTSRA
jgi:hypothetical protein